MTATVKSWRAQAAQMNDKKDRKMNILFIVKEISIEYLGLMYISGFLKEKGHCAEYVQADYNSVKKKLMYGSFDILAYSVPTLFFDFYLSFNNRIKKEFNTFTIFGGPHPTLSPEIINNDSIDCVCRGEGEFAMAELTHNMSCGKPISGIRNLWVKENGRIFKNPLRPLVQDLDSLPFPDRKLFPASGIPAYGKIHVITSRGCPYECSYCCQPAYNSLYKNKLSRVRRRSPKNVIAELKQVKQDKNLKFIKFEDDLFISSFEWVDEFCSLYEQEIKIPFFCYVRAELVGEKIMKRLKRAGCYTVSMGIETADDYLRKNILKRSVSKGVILKAAGIIKREGIFLEGLNMVGIPKGSVHADIETLRLNIECKVDYANTKLLWPYPGTEIYNLAKRESLLNESAVYSFWISPFNFNGVKEKYATENLHKLFSITVKFPILVLFLRKMIYHPLGRAYLLINLFWEGYAAFFILYPRGLKGFLRGITKYAEIFKNILIRNYKSLYYR